MYHEQERTGVRRRRSSQSFQGRRQSAVDAVFSVITGELKKGGDVRLVGFGNFTVSKRAASTGRNPQTGAEVKIPARTVPKFSAGKGLKDAVN